MRLGEVKPVLGGCSGVLRRSNTVGVDAPSASGMVLQLSTEIPGSPPEHAPLSRLPLRHAAIQQLGSWPCYLSKLCQVECASRSTYSYLALAPTQATPYRNTAGQHLEAHRQLHDLSQTISSSSSPPNSARAAPHNRPPWRWHRARRVCQAPRRRPRSKSAPRVPLAARRPAQSRRRWSRRSSTTTRDGAYTRAQRLPTWRLVLPWFL